MPTRRTSSSFVFAACLLGTIAASWAGTVSAAGSLALRSQVAPTRFAAPLSEGDAAWLRAHGELVVGIWGEDFAPIQFRPDEGWMEGVAADYLTLLGNALDVPVRARWFADRGAAIAALRAHEVEAVSAFAEPEDEPGLETSAPYLRAPLAIVRRAGPALADEGMLEGRGVVEPTQADARRLLRHHPEAMPVALAPSFFKALEAVSLGRADYYVGDLVSATYAVEQGWFLNLRVARVEHAYTRFQFVTAADQPQVRRVLDAGLGAIQPWMQ